jgi:hypothetical protein
MKEPIPEDREYFWKDVPHVICELKRNGKLMLRRVVPFDLIAEVVPAMMMIAQGFAVIEVNPSRRQLDDRSQRDDTLLDILSKEFGAAPTAEFIHETIDTILKNSIIGDQHPDLGEDHNQQTEAKVETAECNVGTDLHTEGVESVDGKVRGHN